MTSILVVGVGALGSVTAGLLDGHELVLCDYDIVREENLWRQPMYTCDDIGRRKVDAARERLPSVVSTIAGPFSETALDGIDIVLDGTDNLHSRLVMNDAVRRARLPLVIGAVSGARGMAFATGDACWQCIVLGKRSTDDCSTDVTLEAIRATAEVQARLVRNALAGGPTGKLVLIDGDGERAVRVVRHPLCAACRGVFAHLDAPFSIGFCTGTARMQARPTRPAKVALGTLRLRATRDYGSALEIPLEGGSALVHGHGLIEFKDVSPETATRFAREVLTCGPSREGRPPAFRSA